MQRLAECPGELPLEESPRARQLEQVGAGVAIRVVAATAAAMQRRLDALAPELGKPVIESGVGVAEVDPDREAPGTRGLRRVTKVEVADALTLHSQALPERRQQLADPGARRDHDAFRQQTTAIGVDRDRIRGGLEPEHARLLEHMDAFDPAAAVEREQRVGRPDHAAGAVVQDGMGIGELERREAHARLRGSQALDAGRARGLDGGGPLFELAVRRAEEDAIRAMDQRASALGLEPRPILAMRDLHELDVAWVGIGRARDAAVAVRTAVRVVQSEALDERDARHAAAREFERGRQAVHAGADHERTERRGRTAHGCGPGAVTRRARCRVSPRPARPRPLRQGHR